jgi:hypothetical protein
MEEGVVGMLRQQQKCHCHLYFGVPLTLTLTAAWLEQGGQVEVDKVIQKKVRTQSGGSVRPIVESPPDLGRGSWDSDKRISMTHRNPVCRGWSHDSKVRTTCCRGPGFCSSTHLLVHNHP